MKSEAKDLRVEREERKGEYFESEEMIYLRVQCRDMSCAVLWDQAWSNLQPWTEGPRVTASDEGDARRQKDGKIMFGRRG